MIEILVGMTALIALGALWRRWQPGGLDAERTRGHVAGLVYYYLLPALVIQVLWQGELGLDSVRIATIAAASVALGMLLGWLAARALRAPGAVTGAMILAAGFPNATYMGLPVLDAAFGAEARDIAVQFDYFACTPVLLTAGVMLAQHFGGSAGRESMILRLARVPPLIAAVVGVLLNLSGAPLPAWLDGVLGMLAGAVVPLMLLALGMSLSLAAVDRSTIERIVPVLLIQLLILPLWAWLLADGLGLSGLARAGTILEAAMPSMVLGIVLCDRYGLDARHYSLTVTLSTVLALVTLPLWLLVLG